MPQSATPNMLLVEPSEDGDADVWDTILTTLFARIDLHDHTTGLGVKIPSAAVNVNADVSWSSGGVNYSITDAKVIDFAPVAASTVTSYASALFSNASDSNNLYWRNSAGTNVKITDGNSLNVSIVGGWGGDYASVGALADFDDATDTMRLRQEVSNSVRQFSRVSVADIKLYEYLAAGGAVVPPNAVTIKSPAALAAAYTVTLPAAVPASTQPLMMSSAGVLAPSLAPSIAGPWQGTDFLYTGAQGITLPASLILDRLGTHTKNTGGTSAATNRVLLAASALPLVWELPVRNGDIITALTVYAQKNTANTNTLTVRLYKTSGETGTETALGSGATNSANAPGFIVLSESSLSITVDDTCQYYLVLTPGSGVTPAADVLYHGVVYVKRA